MRNAEVTRERILEAALAEFSAFGIAGARVDRIAKTAGCNKNLIYIYFESKEKLFTTILQKHLSRVYEDIPFTPEDLPGYAARVFDFAMTHPDLMRLITWFSLEQNIESPAGRSEAHGGKVSVLIEAQSEGRVRTDFSPGFLLTVIMTLATAWSAANPFGLTLEPDAAKDQGALRDAIAKAVKLIVQNETNIRAK